MGDGLFERDEAFASVVFEGGKLIEDEHVEGEFSASVMVDQPFSVFSVDHIDVSAFTECTDAFFLRSNYALHRQGGKMCPFGQLGDPCVSGYAQGCDDQDPVYLKTVIEEMLDCGQRNDGFSQSTIQKQSALGMMLKEVNAILLVRMKLVLIQMRRTMRG